MGVVKRMWAIKEGGASGTSGVLVYSTQLRIYWQEVGEIGE